MDNLRPKMVIVAGPPGSGKSTAFPVNSFGFDSFNADDRAAELNGGSYQGISAAIRKQVNQEFEDFVLGHVRSGKGFSIETTLRTNVTFNQARLAKDAGFQVEMLYICGGNFENCLRRVIARGFAGGHSAPVDQLQKIYAASLENLPKAIREMDEIRVYDNSRTGQARELVLDAIDGKIEFVAKPAPDWLAKVLKLC